MVGISKILFTTMAFALVAYWGNRLSLRCLGRRAAPFVVPWWEEACKAGVVLLLSGAPLLAVHLVFGALELTYNLILSRSHGRFLGVLSFGIHGFVGAVSAVAIRQSQSMIATYLIAVAVHSVFNLLVVYIVLPTLGYHPQATLARR